MCSQRSHMLSIPYSRALNGSWASSRNGSPENSGVPATTRRRPKLAPWDTGHFMKIPFVDLHAQYLTIKQEIDRAIADVIAQSAYIRGPHVDAFEEAWARTLGVKRCISCANGTDAIYIALRGLGLKRGDEVITSAHSWISTSETITQAGGRVVFCDTDEETFTIDPADIERKITPATVGIVPVHLYGQAADMVSGDFAGWMEGLDRA